MKAKKFDPDMESIKRSIVEDIQYANKLLEDVPPEKSFWVSDGVIVKNMQELSKVLEEMSDEVFQYHVNKEKNDFVKWIDEVIQDKELARSLGRVRRRDNMVRRIQWRMGYLKNIKKE